MNQNVRDSELSIYKIIIVGQSGVGKSNIISRYVYDKFEIGGNATIGIEFVSKVIEVDKKAINLQIWDTAGQQRFRSVNKVFYKNALGILVVFSLASQQTFSKVQRWLKQLRQQIEESAILILVGNKCDLKERQVSVAEASRLAKQQNMAYIETSAALNINIVKTFQMLSEAILLNFQGQQPRQKKQPILLQSVVAQKKKKKKCCQQ